MLLLVISLHFLPIAIVIPILRCLVLGYIATYEAHTQAGAPIGAVIQLFDCSLCLLSCREFHQCVLLRAHHIQRAPRVVCCSSVERRRSRRRLAQSCNTHSACNRKQLLQSHGRAL